MAEIILRKGADAYRAQKFGSAEDSGAPRTYELVADPQLRARLEDFEQAVQSVAQWPMRTHFVSLHLRHFFRETFGLGAAPLQNALAEVRRNNIIDDVALPIQHRRGRKTIHVNAFDKDRVLAFGVLIWALFERIRQQGGAIPWNAVVLQAKSSLGDHPLRDVIDYPYPSVNAEVENLAALRAIFERREQKNKGESQRQEADGRRREETVQQSRTREKQESVLKKIPEFTPGQLTSLATVTPLQMDSLKETRGMELDIVEFPADRFPVARAVMLIEAAVTSAQKRSWAALEKFDPSLEGVTKKEWNYAVEVVKGLFRKYPQQYGNLGHLFRANVRWIKERAAAHIEERKELQP